MKKIELGKKTLLENLVESFGKSYSPGVYGLWFKALEDVSVEELEIAINRYLKKGKWMPTVAQLRQIVKRYRFSVGEKLIPEIRKKLEKVGEYHLGRQTWQEDVDRVLIEMGYSEGYVDSNRV